jgi:hypothetical protein
VLGTGLRLNVPRNPRNSLTKLLGGRLDLLPGLVLRGEPNLVALFNLASGHGDCVRSGLPAARSRIGADLRLGRPTNLVNGYHARFRFSLPAAGSGFGN